MNTFFGRKAVTGSVRQSALSKLMMTSAIVAAGSLVLLSTANAADYTTPTG